MPEMNPQVGVIMGSKSDWKTLCHAAEILTRFDVPHECRIVSAHRTPVWMAEYICAILFSRIRLRIAGVPTLISCAATRPWPSLVLSSVCEITATSDSEVMTLMLAAAGGPTWEDRIERTLPAWKGAFSLVLLAADRVAKSFRHGGLLDGRRVRAVDGVDLEGQAAPGQRRYRWSYLTNYTFRTGKLTGFAVGGSMRWEDKAVIGYYGKPNVGSTDLTLSDTTRPIYDSANTYVDAWVSYTRRILSDKVRMKLQLNCINAFEGGGLKTVSVNYDASPSSYRIIDPRQFVFSATFDF